MHFFVIILTFIAYTGAWPVVSKEIYDSLANIDYYNVPINPDVPENDKWVTYNLYTEEDEGKSVAEITPINQVTVYGEHTLKGVLEQNNAGALSISHQGFDIKLNPLWSACVSISAAGKSASGHLKSEDPK